MRLDWLGLRDSTAKGVRVKSPSRVRIPLSPPISLSTFTGHGFSRRTGRFLRAFRVQAFLGFTEKGAQSDCHDRVLSVAGFEHGTLPGRTGDAGRLTANGRRTGGSCRPAGDAEPRDRAVTHEKRSSARCAAQFVGRGTHSRSRVAVSSGGCAPRRTCSVRSGARNAK